MFVAEKVLLLLVISLTDKGHIYIILYYIKWECDCVYVFIHGHVDIAKIEMCSLQNSKKIGQERNKLWTMNIDLSWV